MAGLVSIDCRLCWLIAILSILLLLSRSSYCRGSTSLSFYYSSQDFEVEQVGDAFRQLIYHTDRHLSARSSHERTDLIGGSGEDEVKEQNCTSPRQPGPEYNSTCEYVLAECTGQTKLVNYLSFVVCDLRVAQPLGYILLAVWLVYLISLLATTVDNFFVPPLNFLAEKLRISPSIAGITLLALGNGAPDIFVVYSGLSQDDLAMVLGSLTGAGIFITTVVIGSVIIVTKARPFNIDKIDFIRDVVAFMIVVGTVVAVAIDGKVYLLEACVFPLLYLAYITVVIFISYARAWWKKRSQTNNNDIIDEETLYNEVRDSTSSSLQRSLPMKFVKKGDKDETQKDKDDETKPLTDKETITAKRTVLHGLTWPSGSNIVVKVLWFVQWPFSLLRWMSVPPFGYNGQWSRWHYVFAAISPVLMTMLMLLAVKGWEGFTIFIGKVPLAAVLAVIGVAASALLFLVLSSKKPPHWSIQGVLVPITFLMSIIWLYIVANEVVSVLRSLGLLLGIDTAILGLTVLALGNCVADWVADTLVARAGKPEMAFASCFGSPLLSHVIGLSVAMIIKIAVYNHGEPYRFHIHTPEYAQVKLAWIFLGISLVACIILFPVFKFSPPRPCGVVLMLIYVVFVLVAVLYESGVFPVNI